MYQPLYTKTNYSLLSSLIKIDDLIDFAKEHNFKCLTICDNNMYGTMEFYKKCLKANIKPIIGLELCVENDTLLLYAKNYEGYKNLLKLTTINASNNPTIEEIITYKNNLIHVVPFESIELYKHLKDLDEIYLGISKMEEEKEALKITEDLVYINKTLYLTAANKEYLRYIYMIRDGKTIADIDDNTYQINNNHFIIEPKNIVSDKYIETTSIIADKCNLEIKSEGLLIPIYKTENNMASHDYLTSLSIKGLNKRLNNNVSDVYKKRLLYELDVINKMGFSNYFLVVYDYIKYAKNNKILVGPGRGSAAGSLVSYCLGIIDIDPLKYDLLFERFLNPERITMPDIDIDFPDIYRDQVIDYVKEKYGNKHVSGLVTFGTLAAKQAIRDVSRILNIPSYQVDKITKLIPSFTKLKLADFYQNNPDFKLLIDSEDKLILMYKIASFIEGFPRHISQHAAGIVMCRKPLDEVVPLTISDDIYLTAYQQEYIEELGLLKMDFLGLRNLTTIMNIIKDISVNEHIDIEFKNIPLDDKEAMTIFYEADTSGIFQFESDGMRNFLRKLKPTSFEDIVAAIALFRPGPAINIDTYIKRKHNEEKVNYLDPSLKPILENTYGIIIYQEQIMQIASTLAGYTYGEADILRRAMSKKKYDVLKNEEEKFISKSIERGYSKETSKAIYDLILNFANFGFNKSHSVAYSVIAFKMAYLKKRYPKYFYSNLLTSVIGSDSKTREYIFELKQRNLEVLKPDINKSMNTYTVEDSGVRFPLINIRNIGTIASNEIIKNRGTGYTDIFDFLIKNHKTVTKKVLESLIDASCFKSFGYNQKTLYHNLDNILNYVELIQDLDPSFVLKPEIEIMEEFSKEELIAKEKELFGVYISNHPVSSYKTKYVNSINLQEIEKYFNRNVLVVALVDKLRVIDTKKGDKMMFINAADEYGNIDLTIFPKIYQTASNISQGDIILINGNVEKRYDKYQIIVNKIEILYKR